MKIIFYILTLTLSVNCFGQDPQLFQSNWFLTELVLDGNIIEIPVSEEVPFVKLNLEIDDFRSEVCDVLVGDIIEFDNTTFVFEPGAIIFYDCFLQSTLEFEDHYFADFYVPNPTSGMYDYVLESGTNNVLWLTITNEDGDTAIYGNNAALGIEDIERNAFTLYPNPASEKLFVQPSTEVIVQDIKISDLQGRLVYQEISNKKGFIEISTASLNSGMYFVQIFDDRGKTFVERVIKE